MVISNRDLTYAAEFHVHDATCNEDALSTIVHCICTYTAMQASL